MMILLNSNQQKVLMLTSLKEKRESFVKDDPDYWATEIKTINQLIDEIR